MGGHRAGCSHVFLGILAQVFAVEMHRAGGRVPKAQQEVYQRTLADPARADHRYLLPAREPKRYIFEDRWFILLVAEGDILEL